MYIHLIQNLLLQHNEQTLHAGSVTIIHFLTTDAVSMEERIFKKNIFVQNVRFLLFFYYILIK